ncbi:hypothetical protein RugamoR64_48060 [Duganella rhizosphaerae]
MSPGLTVTVDPSVTFKDGEPTIRIDIPPGVSQGTKIKVGTNGAAGNGVPRIPDAWDLKRFGYAMKTTNASLFLDGANTYLGDSRYTNFWCAGINATHYGDGIGDTAMLVDNQWFCPKAANAVGTIIGAPTASNLARCKMTFTLAATTTKTESIWIGFVGALPKRTLPTVILSFDDGFLAWDTYLMDRLKQYDLPASFAIVTGLLGKPNYMSAERVTARFNEPEALFDFVLHQSVHDSLAAQGDARYLQNLLIGRAGMRELGITGDGPNHHVWVESVWDNTSIAALQAAGFLSARAAGYTPESGMDGLYYTGNDKQVFKLNTAKVNLTYDATFVQVQAAIQTAMADGSYVFVNGHDIVNSPSSTYQWSYDNMDLLLAWLAGQVAAGALEVKSHSKWFADATGRPCNRR